MGQLLRLSAPSGKGPVELEILPEQEKVPVMKVLDMRFKTVSAFSIKHHQCRTL